MYVPVLSQVHGLGLLEPTAGGLTVRATASCITADEQREAQGKCQVTSLHGLGQTIYRSTAPMAGRLAGMDPCAAMKMPVCPTPKCLDATTIGMITGCVSGAPPAGVNCSDPWTQWTLLALAFLKLPFCQRPFGQSLPTCLTKDQLAALYYCQRYPKFDGPDKAQNARCWLLVHDPVFWSAYQSKLLCATPAAPAPKQPPVLTAAPLPPASAPKKPPILTAAPKPAAPRPTVVAPPPMVIPDVMLPPGTPRVKAGIGVGGLLAIAAGVAVGGWLLFGKKKKKLPVPAAA